MAGLFYSRITWSIAIVVMAVVFCFQLGLQYGHAHNAAAADHLENKLAQWDAKYHEDEAAGSSATVADHQDAAR